MFILCSRINIIAQTSVSTLNTDFNRNPSSSFADGTMLPTVKFLPYIFTSCTGCKFLATELM